MPIATINFPEPLERFYYFADDQVLTAGQLNQLAGHFDHETRLTRTKGMGIGIVCGLEVELVAGEIRLSKGAAITSSGDMLHLPQGQRFTHFRKLQDEATQPTEDGTVRVRKLGSEANAVPMWRLYPNEVADSIALANPTGLPGLMNLAVVLYLDSWLKSPEECSDTNCDNAGVTQMNDLMVLLVPKQHLQAAENSPNRRRNLPKATVRNVDLAGGTLNNEAELTKRYVAALNGSVEGLKKAVAKLDAGFPSLVTLAFGNASPVGQWQAQLTSFIAQNNNPSIQFVYDFFQDLAASINELWEAITEIPGECCPADTKFPKYVMAGELVRESGVRFAEYRHYFNESPILNEGGRRAERAVFLLKRIGLMMRSFNPSPATNGIRISPSKKASARLGDRAIPFYYQLSDVTPLHEFWSFEKSQLGMEDTNQGYWMRDISTQDDVKNPFSYTTDGSDFYRVEGLVGMDIEAAEKEVERLQLAHNIGFKLETIQIENDKPKVRPFKGVKFPWMNLMFRQYRDDLHSNMMLADVYVDSVSVEINKQATDAAFEGVENDPDGQNPLTKLKQVASRDRLELKSKLENVTTKMYQPLSNFKRTSEFLSFRQEYDSVADIADNIDRKVNYTKQSAVASPIQKLVLDNSFSRFDNLIELLKRKEEAVQGQYVFDRFFNQNPGLRHLGGVPEGGTLVLLYSETTKTILADFSLPYCCVTEIDEDEKEENNVKPPIKAIPLPGIIVKPERHKFNWVDKIDRFPMPRIPRFDDVVKLPDLGELIRVRFNELIPQFDFDPVLRGKYVGIERLNDYKSKVEFDNDINNFVRSDQLENRFQTFVNTPAFTGFFNTNYATKNELAQYTTKTEFRDGTQTIMSSFATANNLQLETNVFENPIFHSGGQFNTPGGLVVINRMADAVQDPVAKAQLAIAEADANKLVAMKSLPQDKLTDIDKADIAILEKSVPQRAQQIMQIVLSEKNDIQIGSDQQRVLAGISGIIGLTKEHADFGELGVSLDKSLRTSLKDNFGNKAKELINIKTMLGK